MIFRIAYKDIRAFYLKEKKVFIWMIISMILTSFVLNFSYSFARYYGKIYGESTGAAMPKIDICGSGKISCDHIEKIVSEINSSNIPSVDALYMFTTDETGHLIVGADRISPDNGRISGLWVEGYALPIDDSEELACAVNEDLLSYDGRIKMTGEAFSIDGESFVIRGVYEQASADVLIHNVKFSKKFGAADRFCIVISRTLSSDEQLELKNIVQKYIPNGSVDYPEDSGTEGVVKMNQMQYSVIAVMLVLLISYIMRYWHSVNISTYTIYWVEGAKRRTIASIIFCEVFFLCSTTFVIGLGLNAMTRLWVKENAALAVNDILMGFAIFFGTMAVLTVFNIFELCKDFSIKNIGGIT